MGWLVVVGWWGVGWWGSGVGGGCGWSGVEWWGGVGGVGGWWVGWGGTWVADVLLVGEVVVKHCEVQLQSHTSTGQVQHCRSAMSTALEQVQQNQNQQLKHGALGKCSTAEVQ